MWENDTVILEKTDIDEEFEVPKDWNIVALNDNYTEMGFVVIILEEVCHKTHEDAVALMQAIHKTGKAIIYTGAYDIALTKQLHIKAAAQLAGFPFLTILEEND